MLLIQAVSYASFKLPVSFTGEPGLELCAGKGLSPADAMTKGLWVPCDPKPGAITINIGDALQYWSDDRLRSTFHRVRVPGPDEYQVSRKLRREQAYPAYAQERKWTAAILHKPSMCQQSQA